MQDFDTLKIRVEETAQKLASAQGERQEQTETLVGILQQLEEKYAAQEQQVAYYRDRVHPLEQANEQLSLLMGNLLDLIDTGFGEDSMAPMRKAADMATAILATDMAPVVDEPVDEPEDEPIDDMAAATNSDDEQAPAELVDAEPEDADAVDMEIAIDPEFEVEPELEIAAEPEAAAEIEIELEPEMEAEAEIDLEPVMAVEAEIVAEAEAPQETDAEPAGLNSEEEVGLIEGDTEMPEPSAEAAVEEAVAPEEAIAPEEEIVGPASVALDLEMEEEALARLEEDIDPAAEEVPAPVEMADEPGAIAAELEEMDAPQEVEAVAQEAVATEESVQEDPITIDEIVGDAVTDQTAEAASGDDGGFEDVSAATLEFEQEEDAASGMDDLPEVVQVAAAAAQSSEMELDVLSGISVEAETGEAGIELDLSLDPDSTADEAEAIAAIAQAIEEEANAENPRTPEPADIRSLLLRVEALAKKAEAMRMAQ
ncbi:MAG: hypothetical protein HOM58_13875, partial [Rhodospirillaceae bacterium]|nr:hypothetical protein [Rhodospirillaceae bacterium]